MRTVNYFTDSDAYTYASYTLAPYIDNVIFEDNDVCGACKGMFYFSLRRPLESEAGEELHFVRIDSNEDNYRPANPGKS